MEGIWGSAVFFKHVHIVRATNAGAREKMRQHTAVRRCSGKRAWWRHPFPSNLCACPRVGVRWDPRPKIDKKRTSARQHNDTRVDLMPNKSWAALEHTACDSPGSVLASNKAGGSALCPCRNCLYYCSHLCWWCPLRIAVESRRGIAISGFVPWKQQTTRTFAVSAQRCL